MEKIKTIEDYLIEAGVRTLIRTNGYHYEFEHRGLYVEFCAQHNYHGSGCFIGKMYKTTLSKQKVQTMNEAFKDKRNLIKNNFIEWANQTRKYLRKEIMISPYLDIIIPELMKLIDLPIEKYIEQERQKQNKMKEIEIILKYEFLQKFKNREK